jgi:hypothetical protein
MFKTRNFEDKSTLSVIPTLSADEIDVVSGGSPSDFMRGVGFGLVIGMMLLI